MSIKTLISNSKNKILAATVFAMSSPAMASGGFTKATEVAEDLKAEIYTFLGVIVFIYLMYNIINAKLGRQQWSDVLVALGHVALAGGAIAGGTWAWSIFS
ncbi:conjugal transfer protein [Vibrio harveyi]|nr:conjugal transfer protein [Vibrio harveyi]